MCPVKRLAKRRIVRCPTESEEDSQVKSSTPPPPSPKFFSTLGGSCATKVVSSGRRINFESFKSEGFEIGENIKALGWDFLCSLDLPIFPNLVKEFYGSLRKERDGLIGTVRSCEIFISEERIARALHMPKEGVDAHFDRSTVIQLLIRRNPSQEQIWASQLPADLRLLHHFVCTIFLPRIGRFDHVTERDANIMFSIMENIPLNLPKLMMKYMTEVASRTRSSLPYGMVLTIFFRESGVQIPEIEPKIVLRKKDVYSPASLLKMKFHKVEGKWIKMDNVPHSSARGESSRPPVGSYHSPPSSGPSSDPPSRAEVLQLSADLRRVEERLSSVENKLDQFLNFFKESESHPDQSTSVSADSSSSHTGSASPSIHSMGEVRSPRPMRPCVGPATRTRSHVHPSGKSPCVAPIDLD